MTVSNFIAALIIFFCMNNLEFISKYLMLLSRVRKNSGFKPLKVTNMPRNPSQNKEPSINSLILPCL